MTDEELMKIATKAKEGAYCPYSNFHVGAAILCKDGKVYTGVNIENSSYGATNCAERTAIFKAVSEGKREFEAIAVAGDQIDDYTFPCGICLQAINEFMPKGRVILSRNGEIRSFDFAELLPFGFRL
ncbi:MAG: cytidine deaminase [Lachnospiraceae bacterium]|nr:cytidine deaminase [Lachnospiraceae bacterium]